MAEVIGYIPQWSEIDYIQFDSITVNLDDLFEAIIREQIESVSNMGEELYTTEGWYLFLGLR